MTRREFLASYALLHAAPAQSVSTVTGPVPASRLGITLTHEHILVDFIGAAAVHQSRYDRAEVVSAALPKLLELRQRGCRTFVDCTPAYLGRDVQLLAELSRKSGLYILTNTGYYGAVGDKYVPAHAFEETEAEIAARWIREAEAGIEGSPVKPAFMKVGVDPGMLAGVDRKLVRAAAICHRQTGLRAHVHTGPGLGALDIVEEFRRAGVHPSAYVWVHAQAESDRGMHLEAAKAGAWISFDGVNEKSLAAHVEAVADMRAARFLDRVLVSQDSGWYRVGEPGGGTFNGYTFLFDAFLPELRKKRFTEREIQQLLVTNPAAVLSPGRPK